MGESSLIQYFSSFLKKEEIVYESSCVVSSQQKWSSQKEKWSSFQCYESTINPKTCAKVI